MYVKTLCFGVIGSFFAILAACSVWEKGDEGSGEDAPHFEDADATCRWRPDAESYGADYNPGARDEEIPRRHLVVFTEEPSTRVLINWGVDEPASGGVVAQRFYLSEEPLAGRDLSLYERSFSVRESGLAAHCGAGYENFQVALSDLKPATRYYYVVASGGVKSPELSFVTAPNSAESAFKLMSGGDSRSDRAMRRVLNRQMATLLDEDPSFLALVHGGDFVVNGGTCADWRGWRSDHDQTIAASGRVLPVVPTFGNHEVSGPTLYDAQFGKLARPRYYAARWGGLNLVILNSEAPALGAQKDWLSHTLAELGPGLRVVGYHRPAFPAVKDPATTRHWVPLFEEHDVDLVLESDGHTMKQTCPIRAGACVDEGGVIYVGEGGLGVAQRGPRHRDAWYFAHGGYALAQHHIQILSYTHGEDGPQLRYEVFYDDNFHHPLDFKTR